ncbi:MAG TPA: AmmeMemoRadiSam system radical SAM enzyme [Phycisphaerae bacterium]|nr:AmmeMemoRadiSam system radical SAM enzyme [Phycisphaerae bacterium]
MSPSVSLKELLARHTMTAGPETSRAQDDGVVQCLACGHRCRIQPGKSGVCLVRFNEGGKLKVPAGYVAGLNVDPIEKKPMYHVLPGHSAVSFGMLGCNFHCSFCQNWFSSQALRDQRATSSPTFCTADQVVELGVRYDAPIVTSTYNEPLITSEWAVEIFKRARPHGMLCGYVSNGHATPEVLEFLRPCAELFKIDMKCFDEKKYRQLGGVMQNVLDTIANARRMGFWVEVVTLVVPGFNDTDDELRRIAEFLVSVDADIPWHTTAFHPDYRMTSSPRTPVETLMRAHEIGRKAGLSFVYSGNLPGECGNTENTYCPGCGALLIERWGFSMRQNHIRNGKCPDCGRAIPGVWTRPTTA